MSNTTFKSLTITHVRYQNGDHLGHFLAWVSLIPPFTGLCGFFCHFLFRREIQSIFFFLGLLFSNFANEFIKKYVQQARPETCIHLEICDTHGWPSSHANYMFFFAVYLTLLTYKKVGILCKNQMWAVCLLVWPMAFLTLYSRVYLGYHSIEQVLVGAGLGTVFGVGWFWMVNSWLRSYFPRIEESGFGRRFYVKDTSHIPNLMRFEYDNARAARKHSSYKRMK